MSIEGQGHFFTLFVSMFCMFCAFPRPRYQVSVYRTIGPLAMGSKLSIGGADGGQMKMLTPDSPVAETSGYSNPVKPDLTPAVYLCS